jgi:hypothetical protein
MVLQTKSLINETVSRLFQDFVFPNYLNRFPSVIFNQAREPRKGTADRFSELKYLSRSLLVISEAKLPAIVSSVLFLQGLPTI